VCLTATQTRLHRRNTRYARIQRAYSRIHDIGSRDIVLCSRRDWIECRPQAPQTTELRGHELLLSLRTRTLDVGYACNDHRILRNDCSLFSAHVVATGSEFGCSNRPCMLKTLMLLLHSLPRDRSHQGRHAGLLPIAPSLTFVGPLQYSRMCLSRPHPCQLRHRKEPSKAGQVRAIFRPPKPYIIARPFPSTYTHSQPTLKSDHPNKEAQTTLLFHGLP
jgi:hypothetical protein